MMGVVTDSLKIIWYKKSLHQKILEMTIKFEKNSPRNI